MSAGAHCRQTRDEKIFPSARRGGVVGWRGGAIDLPQPTPNVATALPATPTHHHPGGASIAS